MRTLSIFVAALALSLPAFADGDWDSVADPGIDTPANIGIHALRPFGSFFYVGTENPSGGARIYRSDSGLSYTAVMTGGFGAGHTKITEFEEFGGFLYAGTASPAGGQVFRSSDGLVWTPASPLAFGDAGNAEVMCLENFAGAIWAGTRHTGGSGGQLWRSTDGTTWTSVTTTGFGDADNTAINDLEAASSELYAATSNPIDGGQLWSVTSGGGASVLVDDGFGGQASDFTALELFEGSLYIGTRNTGEGYEIWSTPNEVDYFLRLSEGGGDPENVLVRDLDGFGGAMYVGPESVGEPFEVLRTFTGGGYNQEDSDGFGDPGNFSANVFSAFANEVWCGTSNPSGAGLYHTTIPDGADFEGETNFDEDDDSRGSRFHCVVATAAFGSPAVSRVDELRRMRDSRIEASPAGLTLTSLYRRSAHGAARAVGQSETLRALVRRALLR